LHDKEIIDLYFDRDQSAVTESERKYGALCLSVSMRILNNKQDAEECVADTWLAAWNCIPPQRPAKLGAFFSRIVRNISVDRLRSQTTAKRGGGETALLLSELDECLTGQSAEDSYMEKETVATINAFLKKLPKKERDFFVLRYYHAYSVKEISEMTGFAENNVRAALSSARKKLKDFLVKRGLL
jgi:RNA polymerase sigma-70 factor (ECF subfamily)